MRKSWGALAALLLIAGALYFSFDAGKAPWREFKIETAPASSVNPPSVKSNLPATNALAEPTASTSLATAQGQRVRESSAVAPLPEETVLQNVRRAIRQYGEMFGGNPVGTNPEITSQLSGNNSKHINFISPQAGLRVNGDGELVDEWGTPYFFHQISGAETEVHSAGPDKIMWTADDLVVK